MIPVKFPFHFLSISCEKTDSPNFRKSGFLGCVLGYPPFSLHQVRATSEIEEIRKIPKPHRICYRFSITLSRDTRCATVPIGYDHGYILQRERDVGRAQDCARRIFANLKLLFNAKQLMVVSKGELAWDIWGCFILVWM